MTIWFVDTSKLKSSANIADRRNKKTREKIARTDSHINSWVINHTYFNVIFVVVYVQLVSQFEALCWSELPSYTRTEPGQHIWSCLAKKGDFTVMYESLPSTLPKFLSATLVGKLCRSKIFDSLSSLSVVTSHVK